MKKTLLAITMLISALVAKAQNYGDWSQGCYYDLNNKKLCGQMKWNVPARTPFKGDGDHIFFRYFDEDTKQKISTKKFKSFVLLRDSFVVSHDPYLSDFPILKVVLDNPTKLYLCLRMNNTYTGSAVSITNSSFDERLYYGDTPDTLSEINRGNYIEVLSQLMASDVALVADMKDKKYRYGKVWEIITEYRKFKQTSSSK